MSQVDIDQKVLREVMGKFATGVTVVTAKNGLETGVGITANSFTSVSLSPPKILWCLHAESPNAAFFDVSKPFCINVLAENQSALAYRFAKPLGNKFENVAYGHCSRGVPVLEGTLAALHCTTEQIILSGDHYVIIGAVNSVTASQGNPTVFYEGRMRQLQGSALSSAA